MDIKKIASLFLSAVTMTFVMGMATPVFAAEIDVDNGNDENKGVVIEEVGNGNSIAGRIRDLLESNTGSALPSESIKKPYEGLFSDLFPDHPSPMPRANVSDGGNGPSAEFTKYDGTPHTMRCPVIYISSDRNDGEWWDVQNIAYCVDPAGLVPGESGGWSKWYPAWHRGDQPGTARNLMYWGYGRGNVGYVETWAAVMRSLGLGISNINLSSNWGTNNLFDNWRNLDPPNWNYNWTIADRNHTATWNGSSGYQETGWYNTVVSGGNIQHGSYNVNLPAGVGCTVRDSAGNLHDYGVGPRTVTIWDDDDFRLYAKAGYVGTVKVTASTSATITTSSIADHPSGAIIYEASNSAYQPIIVSLVKEEGRNYSADLTAVFNGGKSDLEITKTTGDKDEDEGAAKVQENVPDDESNVFRSYPITSNPHDAGSDISFDSMDITQVVNGKFTITLKRVKSNVGGITKITFPTWSEKNGQDDIVWYTANKRSNSDGTTDYYYTVDTKNHNNDTGRYFVHFYISANGKDYGYNGAFAYNSPWVDKIETTPVIDNKFTVKVSGLVGGSPIGGVSLPVWSAKNGQDDINWYEAKKMSDGSWTCEVDLSNHKNDDGAIYVHVYVIDTLSRMNYATALNGGVAVTREYLPGAEFELVNKSNQAVAKGVTDENGRLLFSQVAVGTYTLKETAAPAKYDIIDPITLKLDDAREYVYIRDEIKNTPPTIKAEDIFMYMKDDLTQELLRKDAEATDLEDGNIKDLIVIDNWDKLVREFNQKKADDAETYETTVEYSVVDSGGLTAETTAKLTVINSNGVFAEGEFVEGYVRFINDVNLSGIRPDSKWRAENNSALYNKLSQSVNANPDDVEAYDLNERVNR